MGRTWHTIEVDSEVLSGLEARRLTPDEPLNAVLRRLLRGAAGYGGGGLSGGSAKSLLRKQFVEEFLQQQFGGRLRRKDGFQLMFEDDLNLVYVQNYTGVGAVSLWYRIEQKAWAELCRSHKSVWLCLTNPMERYAFVIPFREVLQHGGEQLFHAKGALEVTLEPASGLWRELNWDVSRYRKQF
ncbi:MAG: hypothetical protein KatS3mg077_1129 [Candidatus Binatia bacterium]|nr:MAG: hypothetical protein KatS3mg077_1129 [Candidatus Binatia bacterium]